MLKNIFALYGVQVIRLILPLLMLPILTFRLTEHQFGLYVYTLSVSVWVSLLVEYGFNISSTRMIASSCNSSSLRDVVINTQSAKYMLSLLLSFLIPLCYFLVPVFSDELGWVVTMFVIGVLTAFMPQYYYQGIENLKLFSGIEILSGVILFFLVYFFAVGVNVSKAIMFSLILTRFLALVAASFFMFYSIKVPVFSFCFKGGVRQLASCLSVFKFQLIVSLYTMFNMIFLGFFVSVIQVGIYGVSERLIKAGLGFIGQATKVFFPRINKMKVQESSGFNRFRFLTLCAFTIAGFLGLLFVKLLSPYVVTWIFSGKFQESIEVISIMAWVIPAIAISNVLSFQYLLVDGFDRALNKIVFTAGLINLILAYYMIKVYGLNGMAYTWVLLEWGVSISLGVIVLYKNIVIMNVRRFE